MSGLIEAAVLNLVRTVTAEYETLLTSHVRAAVQSEIHKKSPASAPERPAHAQLSRIYRHYKTGGYYTKLFETVRQPDAPIKVTPFGLWKELFYATISTNGDMNGVRVLVYSTWASDSSKVHLFAAVTYDAVVYVSLADGEIYIREKKEFEGLVGEPDWPTGRVLRFCPVDGVPAASDAPAK